MTVITKETILTTASDLFAKEGVREVSVDDICRKLSISKKTFYQFYPQKEDLVGAIVSYKIEERRRKVMRQSEGKDAVQILSSFFSQMSRKKTVDTDGRIAKEIEKYYPGTFEKNVKDKGKFFKEFFVKAYTDGVKDGLIREDFDVESVMLLLGLMHRGMVDYINDKFPFEGRKIPFKSLAASFEDMVVRSVLTDQGMEEYQALKKEKQDNK